MSVRGFSYKGLRPPAVGPQENSLSQIWLKLAKSVTRYVWSISFMLWRRSMTKQLVTELAETCESGDKVFLLGFLSDLEGEVTSMRRRIDGTKKWPMTNGQYNQVIKSQRYNISKICLAAGWPLKGGGRRIPPSIGPEEGE